MSALYPLNAGNKWTYKMKDNNVFTNEVTKADNGKYTMFNSMIKKDQFVKIDGDNYLADNFEEGNFQIFLKENLKTGDSWEIKYKANSIDNIVVMTVKGTGSTHEVYGKTYNNVVMIEGEMKMNVNGNIMPINYFTQYYYAKGIGLILTTSSAGDYMGFVSYEIK